MITSSILLAAVILRSLSEIGTLSDADLAQSPEFRITGTVTDIDVHSDFAFSDGTDRAFIYNGSAQPPHPGDRVVVCGRATADESRYRILHATAITVLSHGSPPAPVDATLAEATSGALDYRTARIKGRITDIHSDEISENCLLLTMTDGHEMAIIPTDAGIRQSDYLNAEVAVTGIVRPIYRGTRIFSTYLISLSGGSAVEILAQPPKDRFSVEALGDIHHITPQRIAKLGYRQITGRVCAAWDGCHVLVNAAPEHRLPIHVVLRKETALPACGEAVDVVGCVETDLFTVLLTDAQWRPSAAPLAPLETCADHVYDTTIRAITRAEDANGKEVLYLPVGEVVQIAGTVRRLPNPEDGHNAIILEEAGNTIAVDASMAPDAIRSLQPGSLVRVRGIYLLLAERWRPSPRFPSVYGAQVILRSAADLEIISQPPWWTPKMLVIAMFALLLLAIGIFIWNRILNRIVERRTRALLKERLAHDEAELKKEERTKLAVELHDTLSQNLTGIAFQLDVAELTAESDPKGVLPHLRQMRLKMQSCRDNLKNCLWDLRNLAIDQAFLADSLRETLAPVIGQTEVSIDFPVRNSTLDDSIVHAIICIVRELSVNAVRHGKATRIEIVGRQDAGGICLTVRDNGLGFDPENRLGAAEGHFGLQGVAERVTRFNGEMNLVSRPGGGTEISIKDLHEDN